MEVRLREGKVVGSEKGKALGCGLCYEQRREALLRIIGINFDLTLGGLNYSKI
jgi:hypothetical protein